MEPTELEQWKAMYVSMKSDRDKCNSDWQQLREALDYAVRTSDKFVVPAFMMVIEKMVNLKNG